MTKTIYATLIPKTEEPVEELKRCSRCKELKPVAEFHKDSYRKDGLAVHCRSCTKERNRRYSSKPKATPATKRCPECGETKPASEFHKDRTSEDGLDYWCMICRTEYNRQYCTAHPEKLAANDQRYRTLHKTELRERVRQRRMLRMGIPGSHSDTQWEWLCKLCNGACLCCGTIDVPLTRDHIVPITWEGATDDITNIQPLCQSCNSRKNDRHDTDYRTDEIRERVEALVARQAVAGI